MKKELKQDAKKHRNTAIMNVILAVMAGVMATMQHGGFKNGLFVLDVLIAVVNIGAAGYYYGCYKRSERKEQ
ncbi:hypothetical protein SAMN02910358_02214 [Lachnospiraceae bacterium XBB1006]|nr:hypothetical protein SAMN02910358_02214 [Lachnospiraceae bacterium XBB1006]